MGDLIDLERLRQARRVLRAFADCEERRAAHLDGRGFPDSEAVERSVTWSANWVSRRGAGVMNTSERRLAADYLRRLLGQVKTTGRWGQR